MYVWGGEQEWAWDGEELGGGLFFSGNEKLSQANRRGSRLTLKVTARDEEHR